MLKLTEARMPFGPAAPEGSGGSMLPVLPIPSHDVATDVSGPPGVCGPGDCLVADWFWLGANSGTGAAALGDFCSTRGPGIRTSAPTPGQMPASRRQAASA